MHNSKYKTWNKMLLVLYSVIILSLLVELAVFNQAPNFHYAFVVLALIPYVWDLLVIMGNAQTVRCTMKSRLIPILAILATSIACMLAVGFTFIFMLLEA